MENILKQLRDFLHKKVAVNDCISQRFFEEVILKETNEEGTAVSI